jgi:FdhE protein
VTAQPALPRASIDARAESIDALIASAPELSPLPQMLRRAIRAAAEDHWATGVPEPAMGAHRIGAPLLDGTTWSVDRARLRRLLANLAAEIGAPTDADGDLLSAIKDGTIDQAEIVGAAITYDEERLERLAREASVNAGALGVIAHLGALPLLLASGQRFEPLIALLSWSTGYCPVCGGWPTLAEMRGLEREHWLRCGRCASSWLHEAGACVFCGEEDHKRLGYLAPERERESRRAVTCDSCHGYLKTFATLEALSAAEIAVRDLSSVELDIAAIEAGYARPSVSGYRLNIHVEAGGGAPGRGWRL